MNQHGGISYFERTLDEILFLTVMKCLLGGTKEQVTLYKIDECRNSPFLPLSNCC